MDERVEIRDLIKNNETILCEMKPDKFCYCFLPSLRMLPIAVIWGCIDIIFIVNFLHFASGLMLLFLIAFFAIHLYPCYSVFTSFIRRRIEWENVRYAVTDHRVIQVGGALGVEVRSIDHHEIDHVNITMGLIEKLRHVGSIHITSDSGKIDFIGIDNPVKVYKMLTKTSFDVKSDIEYPNALRPDNNPGYQTKYDNKE
ncbi:PH domain-containing protein [uncultured Traorella sp.]|uniref:PH domain-containing protein n=1 Tax=uncultured Traorella sp. TaxID=1929048 RepID=UPI0025F0B979|nr:PH domain-containing protein [uncultured Traorella sp.]